MRWRLPVVLVISALVWTTAACDLQAGEQSNSLPCTPARGKPYCTKFTYAAVVDDTWEWSVKHPRASQRRPVPYPSKRESPNDGRNRVIYIVYFDGRKIWKFGQTEQVPWTKRANEGKRACEKAEDGSCRVDWMAVSDKRYYNARFLEASLIKGYQLDNGRCPPGQRRSCR